MPCFDGLDTESGWIKRFWELPVSVFWGEHYEFLAFNVKPWERLLRHGLQVEVLVFCLEAYLSENEGNLWVVHNDDKRLDSDDSCL